MLNFSSLNHSLWLDHQDPEQFRQQLKAHFSHTWQQYEALFDLISNKAAYYQKPEPLRHPLIFYFGHTATFFINKLILGKYLTQRLEPDLESMFAVGVDEMSWDDLDDTHYEWPSVVRVQLYRSRVAQVVTQVIDKMEIKLPIQQDSAAWVILMGIEHERIHLETSSVLIRQLPLSDVQQHAAFPCCPDTAPAPKNQLLSVAGGRVSLGKAKTDQTYGWDNEYGSREVDVEDFRASQYLVSNGEYLEFVEADGYQTPRYWTNEGQAWLAYTQARMPRFWRHSDQGYWQRNLCQEMPLPLNWPVEVNQLEAHAFCNWKAEQQQKPIQLPTEAQWYQMRQLLPEESYQWADPKANIALCHYASACPVNRFEQAGFFDLTGNVWQWTDSAIDGFSGFEVHPLYDDFSTPTFDGKHSLMKGGSWISCGNEALISSRYAFRRHFYQHAGFRYVESTQTNHSNHTNPYETDALVSQYLEFHYGQAYFEIENFCVAAVNKLLAHVQPLSFQRTLDIGCSVGRASFELAKHSRHVDAIDFSARFISQAYDLCEQGEKRYTIASEGDLVEFKSVTLARFNYQHLVDRIHFEQGDACNLKPQLTDYDLVYAANLIDRLTNPQQFLTEITPRINQGGYLVLLSPYTWLADYTAKANWLGGFKKHGENFTTLEGLQELLNPHFDLIHVDEVPFVIRETQRKYQHSISEMTIWRKR